MENTLNDIRRLLKRGVFKNEEHIRVAVVCRLLQELHWDIWNPEEVCLEFVSAPDEDNKKVDVALMSKPKHPIVFIEVKAVRQIQGKLTQIERQLRDYNRNNTALISIITDGVEWRLYFSQTGGEFSKKCFKVLNLERDSIEDLESHFKRLLDKSEIQNGSAGREANAYLRLTQKQRLMEDVLPEANRKILEPPFPALPKALIELVKERGEDVTDQEAITFLNDHNDRKFVSSPPEPLSSDEEDIQTKAKSFIDEKAHQILLHNPGELRFTKLIEARIGNQQANNWKNLIKAGIKVAISKDIPVQTLKEKLSINIRSDRYGKDGYGKDGYEWDEKLKLSIQGFDANKAADNLYRLAKLLNIGNYSRGL